MTDNPGEGPKASALTVFDAFLTAFTAADVDAVVGLFWDDALFWGTTGPDLVKTIEAVREYFKPLGNLKPSEWRAASLGTSPLVVSDAVVLISGLWQIENVVDGKPAITPLRVSVAVTRRDNTWRIAQFHNSLRPAQ